MKKLKIITTILKIILFVVIISFILTVLLQRVSDNKLSFFNFRMFSVRTGSMEPKYNIGDVLLSREVDPSEIKIGDAISYLGDAGEYKGLIITHEVINIDQKEDGTYVFTAQGIANPYSDPLIEEDQIYGIIAYKTILLSWFYKLVSNPIGMYILIIVPIIGIIGYEIITRMLDKEDARRKKKKKIKDDDIF